MRKKWIYLILGYCSILSISFLYEQFSIDKSSLINNKVVSNHKVERIIIFSDLESEGEAFNNLKDELSDQYELIELNYRLLSDSLGVYSSEILTEHLYFLLNDLNIEPSLILSNGYGSILATQISHKYTSVPVVMINPEGILEFELLGGYHLNRGVLIVTSFITWSLENLMPDFGFFSESNFNHTNQSIRLNTDLRTLKKSLRTLENELLIINSDSEDLKQSSVSNEIERLAVNSLQLTTNSHFRAVISFYSKEKSNTVISPQKRIKSLIPFTNSNIIEAQGWLLVSLMLLIVFSTFISEDLACIGAGLMAARGLMDYEAAVAASFFGIFFGDILIYLAGRWLGTSATEKIPLKWFVSPEDVKRSNQWFYAKGPTIILISRFIPGTRFPTYFSAGILGTSFSRFTLYFGLAALIWTPLIVWAAYFLGQELLYYFSIYQDYALWVLGGVVVLAYITLKLIIPLFTYRGRKLLYGKLQRVKRWEFWPIYILYAPVVVYVVTLWLRLKKTTVVTAANPGIEYGGFKGESKSQILDLISAQQSVAKFIFLGKETDVEDRIKKVSDFMMDNQLLFPVVLKPDKGERGKSVKIIKDKPSLDAELFELHEDYILQEYISGNEYGIFYYRYPKQKVGQIYSVTVKEKLYVTGDGFHTLEHLILKDKRAICMAETHFDKHADDLFNVPEKGELIKLVELGTHSRGAIFKDGEKLITNELSSKIDELSRSINDFYFGRYDIIAPNDDSLTKGESLKVIELNGVTSESTNIYDSQHSYLFAVKTLCKQWKIAYEIGLQNYKKGTPIPSLKQFLRDIIPG